MPKFMKVATTDELEDQQAKLVEVEGQKIALFRVGEAFHAQEGDLLAFHFDQLGLLVFQLIGRGHLHEFGHRPSSSGSVQSSTAPSFSRFLGVRQPQFFVVQGLTPGLSTKNCLFSAMKCFHCSGVSSSTKIAFTGHTGSQAPQSMHSSGWMKSWFGPS